MKYSIIIYLSLVAIFYLYCTKDLNVIRISKPEEMKDHSTMASNQIRLDSVYTGIFYDSTDDSGTYFFQNVSHNYPVSENDQSGSGKMQ